MYFHRKFFPGKPEFAKLEALFRMFITVGDSGHDWESVKSMILSEDSLIMLTDERILQFRTICPFYESLHYHHLSLLLL